MPASEIGRATGIRAAVFLALTASLFGARAAVAALLACALVRAVSVARMNDAARRKPIVVLAVIILYLAWCAQRLGGVELVGFSYLALKTHHLLLVAGRPRRQAESFAETLVLLALPASFAAGPIERSGFARDRSLPWSGAESVAAVRRMAEGVFKKVVAVSWIERQITLAGGLAGATGPWDLFVLANLAAWSLYLDFSAYSDIAIGSGRLLGYRLTENFRWPLLATDLLDFWRRWHASLTSWLRDHVFLPVGQALGRTSCPERLAGMLSAGTTFLLMGLWHGFEARYLLFGAYHAVGVVVCSEWKGRMPKPVGWTLTYLFVIGGFLVFRFSPGELAGAIGRVLGVTS